MGREKQEDQEFKSSLDCTEFKTSLINTKHSLKKRKKNETSKFQTCLFPGEEKATRTIKVPFCPLPPTVGEKLMPGFVIYGSVSSSLA